MTSDLLCHLFSPVLSNHGTPRHPAHFWEASEPRLQGRRVMRSRNLCASGLEKAIGERTRH